MTREQLKKIAPYATNANIDIYLPLLNTHMHEFNICGLNREAAFMATLVHESGSFKYTKELASGAAYEGRKDLGNTEKGDGVKFKGRGPIQITGRRNYTLVSEALGIDFVANPELLEDPKHGVRASCWWWKAHGCNEIADTGDFRAVTRKVNGGYNGMTDREKWYKIAMETLK